MKKKQIIWISSIAAVCIIAIIATVLLIGSRNKQTVTDDKSGVTRAEWITLLGQAFDLTTYEQNEPHYSDVPSDHAAFTYAQSCYEWGILRDKATFKPDKTASRAFVAETAMLTALLEQSPSVADMDAEALLQLACSENIFSSQSTTYGVTMVECEEIIQKLKEYYLAYEPEDYTDIKLKEDVIDYSSAEISCKGESVMVVPEDVGANLSAGDIFLAPSDNPTGVARKVVSVSTVNGQTEVQTTEPELEEVFESLSFSFTGVPELEDIVPSQDGITIDPVAEVVPTSSNTSGAKIVKLSSVTPLKSGTKKDPISFGVTVNLTKGSLTPNIGFTDYFSVSASQNYKKFFGNNMSDDAGTLLKRTHTILQYDSKGNLVMDKTEQWKSGYEITGKLKVKKLYIESNCKTSGIGKLESFGSELHFEVESSLSVKGKLEGSVPVFETVIPGPGGIWIKVVFSVYVDANGEIAVTATAEHTSNVTYKNKKYKTVQKTNYETDIDIGADIASGIKAEAILTVCGINLVDVSAKAGAGLDVEATAYQSGEAAMICIEGDCYFPTVSISIGANAKTVAHKLGIKATLKLVDKSGALAKSATRTLWHCEVTTAGASNVQKCTWDTYKDVFSESNSPETTPPTTQKPTPPKPTTPAPTTPTQTEPAPTTPAPTVQLPTISTSASVGLDFQSNGVVCFVTGIGSCTDTNIIIPDAYNGLPVASIKSGAFCDNSNLTSVILPDGLESIGDNAFKNCTALTCITIPDSVKTIGKYAFNGCTALTNIAIPDSFANIGSHAFYGCTALTSITIPDSVVSIDSYAFSGCTALTSINIPDNVIQISGFAFSNCTTLTSITIPDNVSTIWGYAFSDCAGLTNVTIGKRVAVIDKGAFNNCSKLNKIYFEGTSEQWSTISLKKGWNKNVPATEVICTDKTVPIQ